MSEIINLDERISNTKEFQIAGKVRKIDFNDNFVKKVSDVRLEMGKQLDTLSKFDEDSIENLGLEEQKRIINETFENIKNSAINFFDEYIGAGSGQEIYEYYKESSKAVMAIINMLDGYSEKIVVTNKQNKKNKKIKHYTSNK